MKKVLLVALSFACVGAVQAFEGLQVDFSTGAGTQAGWEAIGGTGSPSGTFSGYTDLAGAGDITVSLANISFDRLYKNGSTGPADNFPGTDLDAMFSDLLFRNNDAATVDMTISGLVAGTFRVTTFHLNAPNTPTEFDLIVTDADNPGGQTLGNFAMGLGNTSSITPTVITFEVVSNGTDDIVVQLDATQIGTGGNTGGWYGLNGMRIAAVSEVPQRLQVDFSTGAGTQDCWESIGGTGSPSGTFWGYPDLAGADGIAVSLANVSFDRLYKNGTTGPADDFPDTDLDAMYSDLLFRNNDSATVDVTLSGLQAGTFQITTHHLNAPNTPTEFNLIVTDAGNPGGQNLGNFAMGLGNTSSFTPTVITFEVVSNGTDDVLVQMAATQLGTGGNTGGWFGFNGMEIATAPTSSLLAITDITSLGSNVFELTLTGKPETDYEFRSSAVLDFDPGMLVEGLSQGDPGDAGTVGGTNNSVLTTDAGGNATVQLTLTGAPAAFVRAQPVPPPPPLLSEDFETDNGGFTAQNKGTGSNWEYGPPASADQGGGGVTEGNGGSTNVWGTNLTGGYAADTNACLRSGVIDLSGVSGADLSFALSIDADAGSGHAYQVDIIDDQDDTVIANIIPSTVDGDTNTSAWATIGPVAIPPAAIGQPVRIQWTFVGNGDGSYNGAYLDDVLVEVGTP